MDWRDLKSVAVDKEGCECFLENGVAGQVDGHGPDVSAS